MAISEAEVELIAQRAAKAAVAETLSALGLDTSDPKSAQRDMMFLHDLRTAADSTRTTAWYVIVTAGMTGIIGWLYLVFSAKQ